jgi:hypothetical protein
MESVELKMALSEQGVISLTRLNEMKNEVIVDTFSMINVMTGNLDNNDGCDSNCNTEMGWE